VIAVGNYFSVPLTEWLLQRHSDTQSNTVQWLLEGFLLCAVLWAIIRLSSVAPAWISAGQKYLLASLGHSTRMRLINSVIWVIKPNTSWLLIALVSSQIPRFVSEEWVIFAMLKPIGVLYALYRALRLTSEWLLSRMYNRQDQFIPAATWNRIHRHAMVIAAVGCLMWITPLLWLPGALSLWIVLSWILKQHQPVTGKFLAKFSHTPKDNWLNHDSAMIVWPLVLPFVQGIDLVLRSHELLSLSEKYRTFSLRVLHFRLKTAIPEEEPGEKDIATESAQAKSYRYWILERPEHEQPHISQDILLDQLRSPVLSWLAEQSPSQTLLIRGDRGTGKTHLVRQLCQTLTEPSVGKLWQTISIRTTQPEDVEKLFNDLTHSVPNSDIPDWGSGPDTPATQATQTFEEISASHTESIPEEARSKRLIIIDNAENLFQCEPGGFAGLKRFYQLIENRSGDDFYIIIMHGQAWQFLDRCFPRQHPFDQEIVMPRWSATEIRKLILSRHHASKRRLQYDDLLLSALAGTEAASFRAADTRVFNLLWELSHGNPLVALNLWLNSAQFDHNDITIALPQRPNSTFLSQLPIEACFLLLQVVYHRTITSEALIRVIPIADTKIQNLTRQCLQQGILQWSQEDHLIISPTWYTQVINHLSLKNLIYG
ncbi:MAG: AAA family ATPase, partial [Pseudomonadales bacterium]|nr:AAA family ATPase [Pseudomonadales bacterium]